MGEPTVTLETRLRPTQSPTKIPRFEASSDRRADHDESRGVGDQTVGAHEFIVAAQAPDRDTRAIPAHEQLAQIEVVACVPRSVPRAADDFPQ